MTSPRMRVLPFPSKLEADSYARFYIFNFGYSWGPVPFVVTAEIWPMSTRAVGTALGLSANWMANFVVGQVTPDM